MESEKSNKDSDIWYEMCRGQTDRADLGFKKNQKLLKDMNPPPQKKESLTSLVKDGDKDDMLVYLYGYAKQGQWLRWDCAMQVDTSWKKLLYIWTPELLTFHVNDQLPSPANLRLWGKTNLGSRLLYHVNPCSPEGFPKHIFLMGGCWNPPWIINTEGHITLNLLPVYRYGHPLSIDTKISTNH